MNEAPSTSSWRVGRGRRWFFLAFAIGLLAGGAYYSREMFVLHAQRQAAESLTARNWGQADQWLQTAERWAPRDAQTQRLRARVARRRGRLEEAERYVGQARQLGLPMVQVEEETALIQAQRGDLSESLAMFETLLRSPNLETTEVFEAYAIGFMQSRRMLRQSFDLLSRWSEADPQNPQPQTLLARLCLELEDWPRAEKHLRTALEVKPPPADAALMLGRLLLQRQQPAEALPLFRAAATGEDERLAAWIGESACLRRLGEEASALSLLERAEADLPRAATRLRVEWELERARLDADRNELEAARKRLEAAATAAPHDWDLQYELAMVWRRLGRADEARQQFAMVEEARSQLGLASHLTRQSLQNPGKIDFRFRVGQIQMKYGDPAVGAQWLQGVLEMMPNHRSALELLAQHFEQLGTSDPEARELASRYRRQLQALR
ncbi:MAG: tetratricopeptide repeat protein [Pirellulales bacterium]